MESWCDITRCLGLEVEARAIPHDELDANVEERLIVMVRITARCGTQRKMRDPEFRATEAGTGTVWWRTATKAGTSVSWFASNTSSKSLTSLLHSSFPGLVQLPGEPHPQTKQLPRLTEEILLTTTSGDEIWRHLSRTWAPS
eukprot:3940923-Rhodomonas_salina.3